MATTLTSPPEQKEGSPGVRYWTLAWIWIALVLYGSLIPFEFSSIEGASDLLHALTAPRWNPTAFETHSAFGVSSIISDWMLNIALYLPAAVCLRLHLARRRARWWRQWLVPVGCIALLSWLVESLQGLMPMRQPALQDVTANVLGAIVGVAVAVTLRDNLFRCIVAVARRVTHLWHHLHDSAQRHRRRGLVLGLIAADASMLALWCRDALASAPSEETTVNWLPFALHFAHSYDEAVVQLAWTFTLYALLGVLVLLQARVLAREYGAGAAVMLVLALLAVVRETLQLAAGRGVADVTEMVIAVCAGAGVVMLSWLITHTLSRACRRRRSAAIAVERRRRAHVYADPVNA